ncbi:MAG: putative Fe-S cluster protein YjdI [Patiriisocius sp.]|jgi:uncharacterized Fe-S cluster protein YjdI
MKTPQETFSNEEITVTFTPRTCINAEKCARGLSQVFRTTVLPWIDLDAGQTQEIISQIKKCPSGALAFCYNSN